MMLANVKSFGLVGVLLAALVTQGACSSENDARGAAVAFDQTTHPLLIGELESANGTYGALCTDRAGAWSVSIDGTSALDNPALSVVLNDSACVLTLTELRTTAALIVSAPAIVLTTSYQATASVFGAPVEFYGNAKLSAATFAADFVVQVLFSDDPALATGDNTARFAVVVATATAGEVPAPDYTLDASSMLVVWTDVNDVVQTVTGTADLTAGPLPVLGQRYVVVNAAGLLTYDQIDAAYIAGTDVALVLGIPAADFALVGTDLTANQVRTLIIANTVSGVTSYESFEITFHPAP